MEVQQTENVVRGQGKNEIFHHDEDHQTEDGES